MVPGVFLLSLVDTVVSGGGELVDELRFVTVAVATDILKQR